MRIANSPMINSQYKNKNANYTNSNPAFKGNLANKVLEPVNDTLYNWVLKAAKSKGISRLVNKLANSSNSYNHMQTAESGILTIFYLMNTAKNKNIKKEQRMPLMVNDTMVTALATVLSYTLDRTINKTVGEIQDTYKSLERSDAVKDMMEGINFPFLKEHADDFKKEISGGSIKKALDSKKAKSAGETIADGLKDAKDAIAYDISHALEKLDLKLDPERVGEFCNDKEKTIVRDFVEKIDGTKIKKAAESIARSDKVIEGISLAKKMIIFAVIYRYVAPVIMTPLANKVSTYLQHRKDPKVENKTTK